MEFLRAVEERYSCRCFLDKGVEADKIRAIVGTAQRSPSWGNTQPWRLRMAGGQVATAIRLELVTEGLGGHPPRPEIPMPTVFEGEMKQRYVEVGKSVLSVLGIGREDVAGRNAHKANNCNAFGAPVLAYLTIPDGQSAYAMLDAGAFLNAFCLAAADRGLATCIQATLAHYPDIVRKHLSVPPEERIVVGVGMGYADPASGINRFRSSRAPLDEVLALTGF